MKPDISMSGRRNIAALSETESTMKSTPYKRPFFTLATALTFSLLSACGSESTTVADGGIRGTGSSVGPVSGFGSVFVNGVKFKTDGDVVSDDGIKSESQLVEGMILRVEGEWRIDDTGNAERVEYDDSLRGGIKVVKPWDSATRTAELTILGQTVRIDAQTVVKGKMVEQLESGDFVRMSGWRLPGPDGGFRASYLGLFTPSSAADFENFNRIELEGDISKLNTSQRTFSIGTQVVDYGGEDFKGIKEQDLSNQVAVEVEGNLVGGVLVANEIEPDDFRRYSHDVDVDIEFVGPVTDVFDSVGSSFAINGVTVEVTGDTKFNDGIQDASDLEKGLLIQVDGSFVSGGVVRATEISLREADAEVEGGRTSSIDYERRQFEVGGALVQLTPLTIITDDDGEKRLALSDLEADLTLEVEGIERVNSGGEAFLEALKIEQDDDAPDSELELVGRVSRMSNDDIWVLGVKMRISSATEFDDISKSCLQYLVDSKKRPRVEVVYRSEAYGGYTIREIELEELDWKDSSEFSCDT